MIRWAEYEDLEDVSRLAMDFLNSQPHRNLQTSTGLIELGLSLIKDENGCLIVGEKNGNVVGFLAGCAMLNPVTATWLTVELAWWVDPAHRDGKIGLGLLGMYEEWGSNYDMVTVTSLHSQPIHSILKRRGYTPLETIYTR